MQNFTYLYKGQTYTISAMYASEVVARAAQVHGKAAWIMKLAIRGNIAPLGWATGIYGY